MQVKFDELKKKLLNVATYAEVAKAAGAQIKEVNVEAYFNGRAVHVRKKKLILRAAVRVIKTKQLEEVEMQNLVNSVV